MESIYLEDRQKKDEFALRAAKHFAENQHHWTYTDGDIEAGCLFAMRFGLDNNGVVVFTISDDMPTNYMEICKRFSKNQ